MKSRVTVKGDIKDLAAFFELLPIRKKRINAAPATPLIDDPINDLARHLHPDKLHLIVSDVRNETKSIRTFRLTPDPDSETRELPYFRAGQYLSFKADVDGVRVTRPYSISSSSAEALQNGFVEISVRRKDGGFVTEHIWNNWAIGTKVESSGPCGFFYHDDLRDTKHVIGLAGGCGFTPFRSMIKHGFETDGDVRFTLLFGIRTPDEIIFEKELRELESRAPDKLKVFYVCSEPDAAWNGPRGFLSAKLIRELAGDVSDATFFICGPPAMYRFLDSELKVFNLPSRRFRREVFGEISDISEYPDFPRGAVGKTFEIKVHIGGETRFLQASATESVLVALERAAIAPPSQCRSGECGFCNAVLLSGDIFVSPENDGRRKAGIKYGQFHPCATYPVSGLEIKVMRSL
jgi:glycine betaine catabolism B